MSEPIEVTTISGGKMKGDKAPWDRIAAKIQRFYETRPDFPNIDFFENWLRDLIEKSDEPFAIYCHRTQPQNVSSIMESGLRIYESSGALQSTMSMIFNSEHPDIEGCINYVLNSLVDRDSYNDIMYGTYRVLAILPRNHNKVSQIISDRVVPKEFFAFATGPNGEIIINGPKAQFASGQAKK